MFDAKGRLVNNQPLYLLVAGEAKPTYTTVTESFLNNLVQGLPTAWVTVTQQRVSTVENIGVIADVGSLTINGGSPYANFDAFREGAIGTSRASAQSGPVMGGR